MLISLVALNFMVFYPGIGQGLVSMVLGSGDTTPFYTPAWIPIVMIVCLMVVNARQMLDAAKNGLQKTPKAVSESNN